MRSSMKHYIQRSEDLQEELASNRIFLEQIHRASVHRDIDLNVSVPRSEDMEHSKGLAVDHSKGRQRHLNVRHLGVHSDTLSDGFDHGFVDPSHPTSPSGLRCPSSIREATKSKMTMLEPHCTAR